MEKPKKPRNKYSWRRFQEMVESDCARLALPDASAFVAWKLGVRAYGASRALGARFPHDLEVGLTPHIIEKIPMAREMK